MKGKGINEADLLNLGLYLIGIIFILWLASVIIDSFFTVKSAERGVASFFGKVKKMLNPGVHFCLPWISSVKMYSMTPMTFNMKVTDVITKNGRVKGYGETGSEVEKTKINISLTLTTYFSDEGVRLCETARRAPGNNAQSLGPLVVPYIKDVTRSVFSEIPWVLSFQERKNVLDYITAKIIPDHKCMDLIIESETTGGRVLNSYYFKNPVSYRQPRRGETEKEMMRYNPLVQFCLDMNRTSLVITEINFCDQKLVDALPLAEIARFKSEADSVTSNRNVNRIREEGAANTEVMKQRGIAESEVRARMIEVIKDHPDLEFLRTLEHMAKGTSNTIFYQIPRAFENKISSILDGDKSISLSDLLKDEGVVKNLKEALEKVTRH